MQKETIIALVLAPIIGGAMWYVLLLPGRYVSRWVWKYMPEGRLRNLLLKKNGVLDPDKTGFKLPPGP